MSNGENENNKEENEKKVIKEIPIDDFEIPPERSWMQQVPFIQDIMPEIEPNKINDSIKIIDDDNFLEKLKKDKKWVKRLK